VSQAGLFVIVVGFSHAETAGWTAGLTIGSLVLGLVLLPLHVILDRTRGGSTCKNWRAGAGCSRFGGWPGRANGASGLRSGDRDCRRPVRDRDTGWRRIWRTGPVAARQAAGPV
jgi:hypothetical protein